MPLMPSFAAQRSYELSDDCIVVVKYRAWLSTLMDVATKGNRIFGATVATAKTDDLRTAVTRIGELIGYTIQGICLRMRVAVRMCITPYGLCPIGIGNILHPMTRELELN